MRNRYVRTRRWVAGGSAAAFVGLVGVLVAHDHNATSISADDTALAPANIATLPTPTTAQTTPRRSPRSQLRGGGTQSPSTQTAPQPSTNSSTPHTRTRAS